MRKIFDAHCHIYPEKIARAACDGIGQFYNMKFEKVGTVERLMRKSEESNITGFLVHSVSTTPLQVPSINRFLASEVKAHPDKLIGFGTLHPASEDIQGDFENLLELGLKGVKLHPDFQEFSLDSDEAYNICKVFAGKVPLLCHTGDYRFNRSNPDQLLVLMDRLPDLVVIAAHFGGWSVWDDAVAKLAGHKNLYVDTSSTTNVKDASYVRDLIHAYGVEQVLYGTDFPMWDIEEDLERFFKLGLTREEEDAILYGNAKKLLNLPF